MKEQQLRPWLSQHRTQAQIRLTNQLARALTQLNIHRVKQQNNSQTRNSQNSNKSITLTSKNSNNSQVFRDLSKDRIRKDFLFVCFTGLPALPQQYEHLELPGQKLVIYPFGFGPNDTEEHTRLNLSEAHLEKQAQRVHARLNSRKDKPIVFLFHSFGTTIVSTLLKLYGLDYQNRLIGMIAIGPYPVSSTPGLKMHIQYAESLSYQYMLANVDQMYKVHLQRHENMRIPGYPNKYSNLACEVAFGKGIGVGECIRYIRMWPAVLKCFIYGRQENRIDEPLINQTAIYYCHRRKLEPEYEQRVRQALGRKGVKADNVQERFVYDIEGGKHSVHVQRRTISMVKTIINEYLSVLEQIHSSPLATHPNKTN